MKNHNKTKRYGFTLVELLYVVIIISIIIPCIFWIYSFIIKSNREVSARQNAIQQWYEFFERLNILMQDYTIDYEEYFNRQMVWCSYSWETLLTWNNFQWIIWTWWYCTQFTTYWNWNSTNRKEWFDSISTWYHDLYYCSSSDTQNPNWRSLVVNKNECGSTWSIQSYGQYKALFTDVKEWVPNLVWDWDDEELWQPLSGGVRAIRDSNNIQELYLISRDWKNRLFFRRKLVKKDGDNVLFKIQMLRLKWFDAGRKHSFSWDLISTNRWVYDWKIDTWACDASMWFVPKDIIEENSVWWAYSSFYLPSNIDDCWIDLTYWSTTVTARNISISPLWDADLYWSDQSRQINDFIKILIVNWVYMPYYNVPMSQSIWDFKVPLQTTFNMKDFYWK